MSQKYQKGAATMDARIAFAPASNFVGMVWLAPDNFERLSEILSRLTIQSSNHHSFLRNRRDRRSSVRARRRNVEAETRHEDSWSGRFCAIAMSRDDGLSATRH